MRAALAVRQPMTATSPPTNSHDVFLSLDRHAHRHARSVPTLTVLSGPVGVGIQLFERWAVSHGRPCFRSSANELKAVVSGWVAALACQRDLTADALAHVADRIGRSAAELGAEWAVKTLHDRKQFWGGVALDRRRDPAVAACYWLTLPSTEDGLPEPERLAADLDLHLQGWEGSWCRVVAALAGILPPEALPGILLVPPAPEAGSALWVAAATRTLTALVSCVPRLPAAVAAESASVARYLETAPECHAKALTREGIIAVPTLGERAASERLAGMGVNIADLIGPVQRLAADGATEELVESFGQAARRLREGSEDQARSAAERFLFERLESLPQTAGRFVLNGTLDFRFGGKDAEVDLLARGLRLAIELDGYYHFQGPESYRRDRRKDWELRRRGFVVLRFLAEDVVARMEEVLDTILAAVEHCQRQRLSERITR